MNHALKRAGIVASAIRNTHCAASLLSPRTANAIRSTVEQNFARASGSQPLWERLIEGYDRDDPDAWKKVEFIPARAGLVMFFDLHDEDEMFAFGSGADLVEVLADCPGFVFYLTDSEPTFVLAYNDHDVVTGVGAAARWVECGFV